MIKFDVLNRFTGALQFSAEIDCADGAPRPIKLGLAIKWAIKTRAYLTGADLTGAYLRGANLTGANLRGADLTGANLTGADLTGANLTGADLTGAYLTGANLTGADLTGATWRGVIIQQRPIQIYGLTYPVTILDQHMQIGCELHSLAEWAAFDDRRIAQMDGTTAARFWRDHKDALLALAKSAGRGVKTAPAEAAE